MMLAIALGALLLFGQGCTSEQKEAKVDVKSKKDKSSYGLGYDIGRQMKENSVDLDADIFVKAIRDGLAGNKAAITDQEMREALEQVQIEMRAKQLVEMKKLSEKHKQEGEAFLAENAKKEGVVTLPSGLQYTVIKEGTGKTPQKSDKVQVHYRGTLIDGTEFDNSYKRGQPAAVAVDKVIMGWTEALQLMKEGAKWTLYIPSGLAYGERGAPRSIIGPSQTLVFEVELISVQ
jgi:FKBP-type peptidyl-prolyl cis-trans isomerase